MKAPRLTRFSRTDWNGDGVVVMFLGALLAVSLALPWANERTSPRQNFTFSLTMPDDFRHITSTEWGPPLIVAAGLIVGLGALMLAVGPRRVMGGPVALLLALLSLVVLYETGSAMHAIYGWGYAAGVGVLIALIVGIVLPIVALASALTARIVRELEADAGADAAIGVPPAE